MVPLTGLEPVLNRFRWILSPLCLPFHHSGVFNPSNGGIWSWRDVLEGCSKTEIIKFEKVGCLQAQFGLGAAISPRDFKLCFLSGFYRNQKATKGIQKLACFLLFSRFVLILPGKYQKSTFCRFDKFLPGNGELPPNYRRLEVTRR